MNLSEKVQKILEDKFKEALDKDTTVNTVASVIFDSVIEGTPVDTSQAISNWTTSLSSPFKGVVNPHFLGKKGSSRAESISTGKKNSERTLKLRKGNQDVYITNNLDYIIDLENGKSKKQGKHFIKKAVMLGRSKIRK